MKTTLEIAKELGIEKKTVADVIVKEQIKPVHQECRKNYFDNNQVEHITRILRHELKLPEYQIFESKMNYERYI